MVQFLIKGIDELVVELRIFDASTYIILLLVFAAQLLWKQSKTKEDVNIRTHRRELAKATAVYGLHQLYPHCPSRAPHCLLPPEFPSRHGLSDLEV
ncbi:unnamed protein product [Caenorhabditis nigoni]